MEKIRTKPFPPYNPIGEEEALAAGHYEEVFIETFNCAMCKKTFKKDGQLQNHLQSK